jgi:hypothetical protein
MGDGRTIDASGATLYMTSNLPEDRIRSFFSPEFINRLSATVRFNPLDRANVGQILDDLLLPKTLAQATDNGLAVEITDAAKSRIIDYGFDAEMGARPLQRSLDNHVADPASEMILELRAAGRSMDPGTPQQAVLDVADDGSGFVMRSADGEITVPVAARPASEHGRQVSETASANAEAARPGSSPDTIEWNPGFSGEEGGSAMTPPTPQPLPQAPNGGA